MPDDKSIRRLKMKQQSSSTPRGARTSLDWSEGQEAFDFDKPIDRMRGALAQPQAPPSETGEERKKLAFDRVLSKQSAKLYAELLEQRLREFPIGTLITVEDMTAIGRPVDCHYNVVGAAVNRMAKAGLIRKTGRMMPAKRPGMNGTLIGEWEIIGHPPAKRIIYDDEVFQGWEPPANDEDPADWLLRRIDTATCCDVMALKLLLAGRSVRVE
jgi:hypothetical protein